MLTKLDAVNRILDAITEDPVNSLSSGLPDAETAERFLDNKTADILAPGWHCNTDDDYTLTPDSNGHIVVAPTWISVDPTGRDRFTYRSVAIRRDPTDERMKLFSVKDQTFVFPRAIRAKIIHLLPFEDLSYSLRRYITAVAAGEFQKSVLGSKSLASELREEIALALAACLDEEAEYRDANVLDDSPHCSFIARRNDYFPYRT